MHTQPPNFRRRKTFLCVQTALAALALSMPMMAEAQTNNVNINSDGPTAGNTYVNSGDLLSGGSRQTIGPNISSYNGSNSYSQTGNTVTIDNWDDINGTGGNNGGFSVIGGGVIGVDNATVTNSHVEIKGSTSISGIVIGGIFGGSTDYTATVGGTNGTRNSVTLGGTGKIGLDAIGGFSVGAGTVSFNEVKIDAGEVGRDVIGGWAGKDLAENPSTATVTDNTVNISGGMVGRNAYGGVSQTTNVTGNGVKITGGSIGVHVHGGYVQGTTTNTGSAEGNYVEFSGSSNNINITGYVVGGVVDSDGTVTGNSVSIQDSTGVTAAMIGGGASYGSGAVTNNTVNITGSGTIQTGQIFGGINASLNSIGVVGGTSTGEANRVTLSNGDVRSDVVGGGQLGLRRDFLQ
jgi:hypothetical protein